jgi:methylamine dehydrogenase accessory protein MauD
MLISQIFLWLVVGALSLMVLALARQVGVLHERLTPVGALTNAAGPAAGKPAPLLRATALDGTAYEIGTHRTRPLLMLFVARSCPICKVLIPVAQDVARKEQLDLLFFGDGERAEQDALIADFAIAPRHFVNSTEVGMAFQVDKLPHAALVDEHGTLVARGLVNSREHLESLLVARETGFASVQSYLKAQRVAAE